MLAVVMGLLVAAGQPAPASADAAGDEPDLTAPLLDSTHATAAHRLVEAWVSEGAVPEEIERTIKVTGAVGVRVSLRNAGQEVGSGEAFTADPDAALDQPGPPIDLVPLLAQATTLALHDYRVSMQHARDRVEQLLPGEDVAERMEPREGLPDMRQIAVGIEIAHRLQSIHVPRQSPVTTVYTRFAPGFHGLRVLGTEGNAAAVTWPARALAQNTAPKSQLVQPLARLGYPIDAINRVGRADGAPLQRFEVIHILRPSPNQPVTQMIRGNSIASSAQPTEELIASTTDRIASHLASRMIREGQIRGTYHPSTNRFDPPLAEPTDSALAAYALARYGRVLSSLGRSDIRANHATDRARGVALTVGRAWVDEGKGNAAAGALAMMTLCELPVGGPEQTLRDRLGTAILALRDEDGRFRSSTAPDARQVNLATASLIAAALTSLHSQTRDPLLADAARAAIDAAYHQITTNPDVSALPWLMTAHDRAVGQLTEDNPANQAQWQGLARLVDTLNDQHIFERPVLGPPDVIGGFELQQAPPGSPPNPDWRTGQLLLFLAIAIRHEQVRGQHNVFDWLVPAQGAARFIARLTFDNANAYYSRSIEDTFGGVRISLWDNTLAIAPSAIALLALTELQASNHQLRQQQANP